MSDKRGWLIDELIELVVSSRNIELDELIEFIELLELDELLELIELHYFVRSFHERISATIRQLPYSSTRSAWSPRRYDNSSTHQFVNWPFRQLINLDQWTYSNNSTDSINSTNSTKSSTRPTRQSINSINLRISQFVKLQIRELIRSWTNNSSTHHTNQL